MYTNIHFLQFTLLSSKNIRIQNVRASVHSQPIINSCHDHTLSTPSTLYLFSSLPNIPTLNLELPFNDHHHRWSQPISQQHLICHFDLSQNK